MAGTPDEIRVPGEIPGTVLHAEGAQIYECRPDATHQLTWQAREPTATLMDGDKSVGRHYAALHWEAVDASTLMWEHKDGSSVKAKIVAQVAGRSADDLPWLKFGVITQRGDGLFYRRHPRAAHQHARRRAPRRMPAGGGLSQRAVFGRLRVLARGVDMRRFFFDLLVGNVVKIDPGGMVFEHARATFVVADEMAKHLFVWRDDLRDRDAWIRVRDDGGREIYRAAVWAESAEKAGWDQA